MVPLCFKGTSRLNKSIFWIGLLFLIFFTYYLKNKKHFLLTQSRVLLHNEVDEVDQDLPSDEKNGLFGHILANFDQKLAADGFVYPSKLLWSLGFRNQALNSNNEMKIANNSSNVKRILIVASWRTGSSFLGALLNHIPKTFYSFEPLHLFDNQTDRLETSFKDDDKINLIKDIFKCNFRTPIGKEFLAHVRTRNNWFLFDHNFRVARMCRFPRISICTNSFFVSEICRKFPINLIKTVRITNVSDINALISDNAIGGSLKVILLVRDPRGTMASRRELKWCSNLNCNSTNTFCGNMEKILIDSLELKSEFPDQIHLTRYEDLSLSPEKETKKIFQFIGLNYSNSVDTFLKTHTTTGFFNSRKKLSSSTYSTIRNSKVSAFAWKATIKPNLLEEVEEHCSRVMNLMGYKPLDRHNRYKVEPGGVLSDVKSKILPLMV